MVLHSFLVPNIFALSFEKLSQTIFKTMNKKPITVKELFNAQSVSVTLTTDDLQDLMKETVKETMRTLNQLKEEEVVWLSADQVCKRLCKDRSTIWKWSKEGYLPLTKFGNRNRYKLSDVERVENAEKGVEA